MCKFGHTDTTYRIRLYSSNGSLQDVKLVQGDLLTALKYYASKGWQISVERVIDGNGIVYFTNKLSIPDPITFEITFEDTDTAEILKHELSNANVININAKTIRIRGLINGEEKNF